MQVENFSQDLLNTDQARRDCLDAQEAQQFAVQEDVEAGVVGGQVCDICFTSRVAIEQIVQENWNVRDEIGDEVTLGVSL